MDTPLTILNVEDVRQNRDLVRRILESEGYNVVDAVNALEGIEKAQAVKPDLILMDINLPDLDGFSAVIRLRSLESFKQIPILAITARNVSNDRKRAETMGFDGYLNKPIDFEELVSEVTKHIQRGHAESEVSNERELFWREQNISLIERLENKYAELETAYSRLKQFEQAKSDFISVVSHELRTPLTVIHSYAQMLKMSPDLQTNESTKDMLDGIERGVSRLQEIIKDMVSVIRVELSDAQFEFAPVSIRNVVSSVQRDYAETAEKRNITLTLDIPSDVPLVKGDNKQLHSALGRIVGNAIKYTPDGGKVTVTAEYLTRKDEDSESFVKVVVTDTGVGIDLDKQTLIFDKFSTASDVMRHSTSKTEFMGGGAGLGLTIARGVIQAHNGRIWVESPGHDPETLPGSKFYILLPAMV